MATPRIAYRPTEEQRKTVRLMSAYGIDQVQIAAVLDINPLTLRRKFRRELDTAAAEATSRVAESLFKMATTGQNAAAAIFWMKVRGGPAWREQLPQLEDGAQLGYVLIPAKRASTPMIEHEPDPTPDNPSVVRLSKRV